MRKIWARWVLTAGMGLVGALAQGCRQQPKMAPTPTGGAVQQSAPAPQVVTPPEAAPVAVTPVIRRERRRRGPTRQVMEMPQPVTNGEDAARQRAQDQQLLQQQATEAQKIQKENDREVQRDVEQQKKMQEEPRIQDIPEAPSQPGIQDIPEPPPQPRIQDAPGPTQPQS